MQDQPQLEGLKPKWASSGASLSMAYVAWDKHDAMRLRKKVLGDSVLPQVSLCLLQGITFPQAEH